VMLSVGKLGQTYVQIDQLSVGTDLGRSIGDGTSGYQGLYNVRRMTPEGMWTATWTKADEDLGLTMTMPAGGAREVIVADASPELQPGNPDVIQYVLGRNGLSDEASEAGEQLFSKYVSVIEPHRGAAKITSVEYLQGDGADPETVGLAVHRGETTDLVHSTLTPERECAWSGGEMPFTVAAEFALVTLDADGVRRAVVVNGTSLKYGDFSLQAEPSPTGKVLDVDFASNSITIDTEVDATRGGVMILGNELHQTSYTIEDVEVVDGRTRLRFGDVLYVIGMGVVADIDSDAATVASDRELSGYGRVDGGLHVGRWLYNENRSKGFRIARIENQAFRLGASERDLNAVFTDADGDGRRVYWISDIGPGDTYRIPTATHYER